MASRHPDRIYRGASGPRVDLPPPEIPKSPLPWFIVVLVIFAFATVVGVLFGFWRAANPSGAAPGAPAHPIEAPPAAPAP
jgi:hypothetical protein